MAALCGAKTRTGGTCKRVAGFGTSHVGAGRCKSHGGATRNGELSGNLELAKRDLVVMGREIPIEPADAILLAIRITAGEVAYCCERIAELEEAFTTVEVVKTRPLSLGAEGESASVTVEEVTRTTDAKLDGWINARRDAMNRLVAYSAAALKANIEERQVRVAERFGDEIAERMRAFAVAMGHDPADERVRVALRSSLKLIEGGAEAA